MAKDSEMHISILEKNKFIKLVTPENKCLPFQLNTTNGQFIIIKTITTLNGQEKSILIPDTNHHQTQRNKSVQIILVTNFNFKIIKNKRFLNCDTIYLLSANQRKLETLTIICEFDNEFNNIITTSVSTKLKSYKILQLDEWEYSFNDLQE